MPRKLSTFLRLPWFVKLWLVPAWLGIGFASVAIALLPFRILSRLFGRNLGAVAFVPLADGPTCGRARVIGRTIRLAASYAPFRSNCLPQAIIAQALCRLYRIPHAFHFGISYDEQHTLRAHAWVVCARVAVTGGPSFGDHQVVSCFVPRRLADRLLGVAAR